MARLGSCCITLCLHLCLCTARTNVLAAVALNGTGWDETGRDEKTIHMFSCCFTRIMFVVIRIEHVITRVCLCVSSNRLMFERYFRKL